MESRHPIDNLGVWLGSAKDDWDADAAGFQDPEKGG
jgi:hypothetical protein